MVRNMGFGLNFDRGFRPMAGGGGGGAVSGGMRARTALMDDPSLEIERMRQASENFRAGLGADTSRHGFNTRQAADMFGAEQAAGASRYGADQRLREAEQAAGASRFGAEQSRMGAENVARTHAEAAMLPSRLQHERFGAVFPWLQGQLGGLMQGLQGGFATPGGASGQGPEITAGPVWTQDQVQQQVNARTGANDQATAGRVRDMQQRLSARGFQSNSPLAQALEAQYMGQNLAENATAGREIPWQAAQGNAQQLLAGQQAREDQYASRQREDIARRTPHFGTLNQLIGMLGSLV